jgi:hypothetical protein
MEAYLTRFPVGFTSSASGAGMMRALYFAHGRGERKGLAMNGDSSDRDQIEQPQDETLTCEISDEALEAAAGTPGYPNVTEKFTSWTVNNCLLC